MARRGRGARVGLGLVVLCVLLVALLLVADRVAAHVVAGRVSSQLQRELGTPTRPAVDIERFPFLTQVFRGSLTSVHIVADDIPATDQQSTGLAHVDLRLRGVTSPDQYRTFVADQVDGTATLDYGSVQRLVGHPVSYAPDGLLALSAKTTFASVPVTATVAGKPSVDVRAQTLTLADPRVSVAGVEVPASASSALLGDVLKPVPITGIPYHLSLRGITATPNGLVALVTGTHVTFTR